MKPNKILSILIRDLIPAIFMLIVFSISFLLLTSTLAFSYLYFLSDDPTKWRHLIDENYLVIAVLCFLAAILSAKIAERIHTTMLKMLVKLP